MRRIKDIERFDSSAAFYEVAEDFFATKNSGEICMEFADPTADFIESFADLTDD
jgi:hypothetical protein